MNKILSALVAFIAALAVVAAPANAQSGDASASDVRVLHGIPGATVDIYLDGGILLPGFTPKSVAGPMSVTAGDYPIEIYAAMADPPDAASDRTDTALIDETVSVPAGESVSLLAHLDVNAAPDLTAFVNDISAVDSVTQGRLTIRHAAAAPIVDVVVDGAPLDPFVGLSNGEGASAVLPAGTYEPGIAAAGTTDVILAASLTLDPGEGMIVYAIGNVADDSLELFAESFFGLGLDPEFRGLSGADGTIARVYLSILGRSPDTEGFAYWKQEVADGLGFVDMIYNFEFSEEFQTRFPDIDSDADFLELVYENVLGRQQDEPGRAYWQDLLDSGEITRYEMLFYFAESEEFKAYTSTE